MTPALYLSLVFGGLICLMPLCLYIYWLASINRRDRPTVVPGTGDFIALLAALGGCLVCIGLVLSAITTEANPLTRGGFVKLRTHVPWLHLAWLLVCGGYLALLALAVLLALRRRRRMLVVYNLPEENLDAIIAAALETAGVPARRFGNRWSADAEILEVVPFHAFRNATIRFLTPDPRVREELERELRSILAKTPAGPNPAAQWLFTGFTCSLVSVVCCIGLIFLVAFSR